VNDGVTEFTTLEASIKVVIADARRIVDFSRSLGRTGGGHESDRINRFCLEKPQSMNCMRKFIFSIIVVFCLSSDLCHVFGSNIKDDISDSCRATKSRWFSRKLSLCPVKHLLGGIAGDRIVDGNGYKLKLSSVRGTWSARMGMMEVVDSSLGICNVRYGFSSFLFSRIALPMDQVLYLSPPKSRIANEINFITEITLYLNRRQRWGLLLRWELWWSERSKERLVEDGVYPSPGDGECKFISTLAYLSFDRKGAIPSIL
jgi:hypothetical protein